MSKQAPAIVWFREDLRLHDHPALAAAVDSGRKVLPVYVLDEEGDWAWGAASRWWLHPSLEALAGALDEAGAKLMLMRGDPAALIEKLADETGAAEVHAGRAHMPAGRKADEALGKALGDRLHLHRTMTLFGPDDIKTKAGGIYGVYTPYARACRASKSISDPIPAPKKIAGLKPPRSDKLSAWKLLPTKPDWAGGMRDAWTPGEAHALRTLDGFLDDRLGDYKRARNVPGEDGTSRLSPHLHWGEISPRTVWQAAHAKKSGPGRETFLSELLWREFAAYLLWHHGDLPDDPLRPAFASMPYRKSDKHLRAWQRGQTGVPIVDAGMRQLWQIGWMHNRVRMIVASYLIKNLMIDWRDGERWFWDTLVDADLGNNSAGWQWVAGSGTDSQPFFRIFNPVSQGKTWDKTGEYVRTWVPELRDLPDRHLHEPWAAPAKALADAGVTLGETYPEPLVDLGKSRREALDAYRSDVRKSGE